MNPLVAQVQGDAPRSALDAVMSRLDYPILDNPLSAWIIAALTFVAVYAGIMILRRLLVDRLKKSDDRVSTRLGHLPDKVLADIRSWCILASALYAASAVLALPRAAGSAFRLIFIIAISFQILITSRIVVDWAILHTMSRTKKENGQPDPSIASASGIIRFIVLLILIALLLLLALDNMNVEITPLITGLGIGGVAVALAAQSILGDLFGSLTIIFDKPFLVGDFIVIGDKMGTVESIGVKTTRLRALSGEQLVFANSDLLSSRIQNFQKMFERRVQFNLGVVLETPPDKVVRIPTILKEVVASQQKTRFDRAHLKGVGDYSLDFEIVYFVVSPDYNLYMDIQQAIYFQLLRRFAEEEIGFAYPTAVRIERREDSSGASSNTTEQASDGRMVGGSGPPHVGASKPG